MLISSQLRQLTVLGVATLVLATGVGLASGLGVREWLVFGLSTALALWIGGAVSGQVLLARLLDRDRAGDLREVLDYLRQLLWIIPRFYVPLGVVALGCGIGLVAVTGTSFGRPSVIVPLVLYVLTAAAGTAISAPGYVRLLRLAEHPEDVAGPFRVDALRARLLPLAWVNRAELALVVGIGGTLLVGAV